MLKIGLTGGIGCGKSTACGFFSQLGVPVIDTDELARLAVKPDSGCLKRIVEEFGKNILFPDGNLNRTKLREVVFATDDKLRKLEAIIHPEIRRLLAHQLEKISAPYVIIAIPLLIEKQWNNDVDRILVIDCPEETQIERAASRDNSQRTSIQRIIDTQATRQQRVAVADDILRNDSNLDTLRHQVEELHLYYTQLSLEQ